MYCCRMGCVVWVWVWVWRETESGGNGSSMKHCHGPKSKQPNCNIHCSRIYCCAMSSYITSNVINIGSNTHKYHTKHAIAIQFMFRSLFLFRYVAKPTDMYRLRCNCLLDLFVCFSVCFCVAFILYRLTEWNRNHWRNCKARQQSPIVSSFQRKECIFMVCMLFNRRGKTSKTCQFIVFEVTCDGYNMKTVRWLTRNIYSDMMTDMFVYILCYSHSRFA